MAEQQPAEAATVSEEQTSGLAIAALVTAILGFLCGVLVIAALRGYVAGGGILKLGGLIPIFVLLIVVILPIVAIVEGFAAVRKIGKSERLSGRGLAIAGIVLGFAWIVILISGLLLAPATGRARPEAIQSACLQTVHNIGLGLQIFRNDNEGQWPDPLSTWCDQLVEGGYMDDPQVFVCPARPDQRCGYALNENLAGRENVHPRTVVAFESDLGWNGVGGPEDILREPPHPNGYNVLFADGSVRNVSREEIPDLRWEP